MSEEKQLKLNLMTSSRKIYDDNGKELSVHFRVNHKTKELEIIINRSCNKCLNFKKTGNDETCTRCHYLKNWLELGKI